jgi:hypothetical protein
MSMDPVDAADQALLRARRRFERAQELFLWGLAATFAVLPFMRVPSPVIRGELAIVLVACGVSGVLTARFWLARRRLELELIVQGDEGRRI